MDMLFVSFWPFAQHEIMEGRRQGYPGKILKFNLNIKNEKINYTWNFLRNSVFRVITTPTYKEPSPQNSF